MEICLALSFLLVCFILLTIFVIQRHYTYWQRRHVLYEKPHILMGNMSEVGRSQTIKEPFNDFYQKFKNKAPLGGFYLSFRKAVILMDLDLIQQILTTDFNNFTDRGNYYNEKDDPLSAHLFNLDGIKWKQMRNKLTSTFSTAKIKLMFPIVKEKAESLVQILQETCEDDVEIVDFMARYATDVIGSCAFGLECNSLNEPNTAFRVMGRKAFRKRRHGSVISSFAQAYPNVSRTLGITVICKDVSQFMMNVIKQTVEYREREHVYKNDFVNLLIELKNSNNKDSLTMNEIAAQAFVMFLGAFENTANTMGFALYEMALNQDIQKKAREEINAVMIKYNNQLNYESLRELKYLKQILYETMRKYPVAFILMRIALNDYKIPNTSYTIEKGMITIIPVDAIHHDSDIYPNPSVFQPERFTPEEIAKRHTMSWLPFGEGPRNCIGLRFAEMETMIGLALLMRNFNITLSSKTPIPLEFAKKSFVLNAKGGIFLKFEKLHVM